MKSNAIQQTLSVAAILTALCAANLPQNSAAQDSAVPQAAPAELPADILPTSPLAEVIKLTQAGVNEKIIQTYIANSSAPFNLDTDKIIYLTNIGMPDGFVTAMMQHDQTVQPQTPAEPAELFSPAPAAAPDTSDDTQVNFDDTLSPYGSWVVVEGYGRCWRPTAAFYDTAWQPYSDHGHWINTDAGWYWASDYSWGVTFHYGRWFRDTRFGWCWWPDTTWAPSWVAWRYSDDYCGWAPLPPRTVYREGVGIFYNGVAVGADFNFGLGVDLFTFVPVRNFCDPHLYNYRVAHAQVAEIFNRTTVINNYNINSRDRTVINNGIPPERISALTHVEIPRLTIRESSAPVSRGEQISRDTVIVNRPHFADHPAPAVPAPHNPPPQNNFPRPENQNLQPQHIQPAQPENPQRTIRVPQNNTGEPADILPHPAPVENHPAPVENHPAPTPDQPQSQPRNFNPRQNDSQSDDTRPSRSEQPPAAVEPAPQTAAPAMQPSQRNYGRQDKNGNGPGN